MAIKWELSDYVALTTGGSWYFFRPRSLKARLKWHYIHIRAGIRARRSTNAHYKAWLKSQEYVVK